MAKYPDPATISATISDTATWTRFARFMNGRFYFVENPDFAGGAKGDGTTDDTAAINACIAASSPGDTILFKPGATYLVSSPIIRKTERAYIGAINGWMDSPVLKVKNGSSANFAGTNGISGVFVPESWDTNASIAAGREAIMGIAVDGNRANNATGNHHGFILHGNFWSTYVGLRSFENRKDGIHMTAYGKDNSTSMATGVSDLVLRDIMCTENTGAGIYNRQHTVSGSYLSDVVLDGSILLFSNDTDGLYSENSGGWALDGTVHHWDNGKNGVVLLQAFGARIHHVYGESLGGLGTSGEFLFGLRVVANNGRGAFVHDCQQIVTAPVAGVTHIGISIETNDSDVHIWAHDLEAQCLSGAGGANEYGFQFWSGNSGGNILKLHSSGGLIARGFQDDAHAYRFQGSGTYQFDPPLERTATATYDPPSVAANGGTTTTVTVAGAVVGDEVLVAHSTATSQAGIIMTGWVSAANTVTVQLRNVTASAIDLATGTLRVTVRKRS